MLQRITLVELRAVKEEGVGTAIAGMVLSMIFGVLYAFGAYAFYLSIHVDVKLNDYSQFFLIFPFMYLSINIFISYGEKLMLFHRKINMIVAIITSLIGFSLWVVSYLYNFYLIATVLVLWTSPLLGLLFTIPFHCTSKYFPTYNNRLNSLFLISQGIGAALFTFFLKLSSNPSNQNIKDLLNSYEIAKGLRLIASCLYISSVFIWFNLKYNKDLNTKLLMEYQKAAQMSEMNLTMELGSTSSVRAPTQQTSDIIHQVEAPKTILINPTSEVSSISQAIFSLRFIIITIASFTTMSGFLIISSYKLLSQFYDSGNDTDITLYACLGFLLFGTARLCVRQLAVKIGFKTVFYLIGILQIVALVSLFNHSVGINISLFIYVQGCLINWFNLFIPRVFGFRYALKLIQIMLIIFSIGNITIHILFFYLQITTIVQICLPITVVSMIALLFLKEQAQWKKQQTR